MAFQDILRGLERGSKVAVVTMTGSCCPVTRAHVQAFVEARHLLLHNHGFDCVLGALSLNPDKYVGHKLSEKGLPYICKRDRARLVELACQEHPWLEYSDYREKQYFDWFRSQWGHLKFSHYLLNGADDVLRRKKWTWEDSLQIVMCRPGSTQNLCLELKRANVNTSDGTFIVGPELEDISSTEVRNALSLGDQARLVQMLHPEVAHWCWVNGPYRPPAGTAWADSPPRAGPPPDTPPAPPAAEALEAWGAERPPDAPPMPSAAAVTEARRKAANQLFKFVSGVLNKAFDEGRVTDCAAALELFAPGAATFAGACDGLAAAMDEGLVPPKGRAVLAGLAHALPAHGIPDSAKLSRRLHSEGRDAGGDAAPDAAGAAAHRRWRKSAAATSAGGDPMPTVTLREIERLCGVGTAGEELGRSREAMAGSGQKAKRAAMARETLGILAAGSYTSTFRCEAVDISGSLCRAVAASRHVPAERWSPPAPPAKTYGLDVEVSCCTVLAAAQMLAASQTAVAPPGVLNFASARNPGGGFTTGAEAQEESLARSSGIYPCLSKHFDAFFVPNRNAASGLYTHGLIHSPAVPVLRDESGCLLDEPYLVDFVTCAAPNCGVLQKRERDAARQCGEALRERMRRVLLTFASNGCADLVLGAWGCGVFGNDPRTVAQLFRQSLAELGCFRRVTFAVLDPRMAQIFADEFRVRVEGLDVEPGKGAGKGKGAAKGNRADQAQDDRGSSGGKPGGRKNGRR